MSFLRIVFLPDFENFSAAIKPDAGDLCQCSASGDEKEKFMQDPGTGKYSCSSFPGIFPCDPVGKTAPYPVGRFPQMKSMQGFHGNGFVLIDLPIGHRMNRIGLHIASEFRGGSGFHIIPYLLRAGGINGKGIFHRLLPDPFQYRKSPPVKCLATFKEQAVGGATDHKCGICRRIFTGFLLVFF